MIRKFTIKNFKQFVAETVIELDPLTLMIGTNNSGKSTVLQALSFFQYCLETTRKKTSGQDLELTNRTIGPEEFGALPVASPTDLWPNGKAKGPIVLSAVFSGGARIGFEIKLAYNRFGIAPKGLWLYKKWIERTRIRHVPVHTGIILREEYRLAPAMEDTLRRLEHGTVIRNLLWELKENDEPRWKRLQEVLQRVYPEAKLDVVFDRKVDRFIGSKYSDQVLGKPLDLLVSGSGFQQVLQILTGVLSQRSTFVLLDEPDSHLHARLQVEVLRIFQDLAAEENIQFLIATHSPHLVGAAPAGALRAMIDGKSHPFAKDPEQMDLLDTLGAFDRMEILPLLKTKAVVFVENRDDREYLECFAKKFWGAERARKVWDKVSFMFSYQEPIAAKVHLLARPIRDLLRAPGVADLAGGKDPRFLVVGDRDYRRLEDLRAEAKDLVTKATSQDFKLELDCVVWERNEIENYLVDREAIKAAIVAILRDPSQAAVVGDEMDNWLAEIVEGLQEAARDQIAEKLQISDSKLRTKFSSAKAKADEVIQNDWGDGGSLCDAKLALKAVRRKLQDEGIKTVRALSESMIIEHMVGIPLDVRKVLNRIASLAGTPVRRRVRKTTKRAAKRTAKKTSGKRE